MRITVRQLKGLIRESIQEAMTSTGYDEPGVLYKPKGPDYLSCGVCGVQVEVPESCTACGADHHWDRLLQPHKS
jgi:hypothetical protein